MTFCGVLLISPPKCLSRENRFEAGLRVSHVGVNHKCLVLQDLQNLQQLLKTVLPEGVVVWLFVEVVEKAWVAFSSSDQEEYHHGEIHLKVIEGLGCWMVSLKSELPFGV